MLNSCEVFASTDGGRVVSLRYLELGNLFPLLTSSNVCLKADSASLHPRPRRCTSRPFACRLCSDTFVAVEELCIRFPIELCELFLFLRSPPALILGSLVHRIAVCLLCAAGVSMRSLKKMARAEVHSPSAA
jgi:hypothetical protein